MSGSTGPDKDLESSALIDRWLSPDPGGARPRGMHFRITDELGGQPSWSLHDSTGQLVAWAGQTFGSLIDARRAAESFRARAKTARYDMCADQKGTWRWEAWSEEGKIAASAQSFRHQLNARRAAASVRDGAGAATGPRV